jgi:hypothetical protein
MDCSVEIKRDYKKIISSEEEGKPKTRDYPDELHEV